MDATFAFAKNIVDLKYEQIPQLAVEAEKKQLLDTLGVALAGSSKDGVKELFEVVKSWGGKRQSTIIGYGIRLPAPHSAQVNATMAHALDYDDGHEAALVHTGAVVVPTCLAIAEQKGKVSGKGYIAAAALATDLMCRLGLSTRPNGNIAGSGWHFTPLYGFLGAAAGAGRILGLNEDQMVNALGIAYHQTAGNMQCIKDGALTKRMGPGFAARGGIAAALMAQRGITGAKNCLEGQAGLFTLYHEGDYDAKALVQDLGIRFESVNVGMKPYPCCGIGHIFIDLALALAQEQQIRTGDIGEIKAIGGESPRSLSEPLEIKRNPRNGVDAQFSLPWGVATALVRGTPSMEHYTDEAVKNDDILTVSRKVSYEVDSSLTRHGAFGPGILRVVTKEGKEYIRRMESPRGSQERPLTFNDCVTKFFDCVSYSMRPVSKERAKKVVGMIERLEKLNDVTQIIRLVHKE
jgi:2-methylcitrate dehydratase PrpD